jgi:hypothetical protein
MLIFAPIVVPVQMYARLKQFTLHSFAIKKDTGALMGPFFI